MLRLRTGLVDFRQQGKRYIEHRTIIRLIQQNLSMLECYSTKSVALVEARCRVVIDRWNLEGSDSQRLKDGHPTKHANIDGTNPDPKLRHLNHETS